MTDVYCPYCGKKSFALFRGYSLYGDSVLICSRCVREAFPDFKDQSLRAIEQWIRDNPTKYIEEPE